MTPAETRALRAVNGERRPWWRMVRGGVIEGVAFLGPWLFLGLALGAAWRACA